MGEIHAAVAARVAGTAAGVAYGAAIAGGAGSLLFRIHLQDPIFVAGVALLLGGLPLAWKSQFWGGAIPLFGWVVAAATEGWQGTGASGLAVWPAAIAAVNLTLWWKLWDEAPEEVAPWAAAIYRAAVVGEWLGRVAGTLAALFFLAFVVGEGAPPLARMSWKDDLVFLAMAALFAGLLLAWKWPLWGGIVPLAGFAAVAVVERIPVGLNWPMLAAAGTGALNLVCWWELQAARAAGAERWQVPRAARRAVGAGVGVFVALCANEVVGNPPLMTPRFRPEAGMVGEWRAAPEEAPGIEVVLEVGADGRVTGSVGDAAVMDGRMGYDRSWFGKLMKWREDYAIRGRLAHGVETAGMVEYDGAFTAPLSMMDGELRGEMGFRYGGFGVRLRKE